VPQRRAVFRVLRWAMISVVLSSRVVDDFLTQAEALPSSLGAFASWREQPRLPSTLSSAAIVGAWIALASPSSSFQPTTRPLRFWQGVLNVEFDARKGLAPAQAGHRRRWPI
jgi:hypothetical protein